MTTVLRDTPHNLAAPVVELVAQGMGKHPAAEIWRKLMAVDLSFYKSPIAQEIRAEAKAEGQAEGEAKGQAEGQAKAILSVLELRGVDIPDDARERISTCADLDVLARWLTRTLTAVTVDDLFADE